MTDKNSTENQVLSVGELCSLIKTRLETGFAAVKVRGELSNLKLYDSGHAYFTIKEPKASLSAVLFAGVRKTLPPGLELKDGMKAVFSGRVSFYSDRGQCQIIVTGLSPEEGQGDLYRQFEELKAKLYKEGLFAPEHKKALPWYPRRVGVITSTGGSVLHDIIETSASRAPGIDIIVYPSAVQGAGAAAELVRALEQAERDRLCDVIIIARGGGSLEDLWPFNDEGLARAIFAAEIPIVSGVGHEPDVTICDFVADLRAPTPSTAALRVFPEREALSDSLFSYQKQFGEKIRKLIRLSQERLGFFTPESLTRGILSRIEYLSQRVDNLAGSNRQATLLKLTKLKGGLETLKAGLGQHDPGLPFKKGYALVKDKSGRIAKARGLKVDDQVSISFFDGEAGAKITALSPTTQEGAK